MNLRDLLNAGRWRYRTLHAWAIEVVHRGADGGRRTIGGARIHAVQSGGIEALGDASDSDTVFVPYHRFLAVRDSAGQLVWAKGEGFFAAALEAEADETSSADGGATEETAADQDVASDVSVLAEGSREERLVIDGSAGEGGGQIVRSSLTLSMLTGRPVAIENIRAGRRKPGLMRQHLTCVNAAAAICGAEVEGDRIGSSRLVFSPGPVVAGRWSFAIGTAGSVSLVAQTIALPLAMADGPSEVTISGGTHAQWAPIVPFLQEAWAPLVRRMGLVLDIELVAPGFYPAGGGTIVLRAGEEGGGQPAPLHLAARPGGVELEATAVVSNLPEGIARRELSALAEALDSAPLRLASRTLRSPGPGNALWLVARGDDVTNVFSAIGERGVAAEDVGLEAASRFQHWRERNVSVGEYLTDQLVLPIAIAGQGAFTTGPLSLHAWTNLEVIAAFTGKRFRVHRLDGEGQRFRVSLTGREGS